MSTSDCWSMRPLRSIRACSQQILKMFSDSGMECTLTWSLLPSAASRLRKSLHSLNVRLSFLFIFSFFSLFSSFFESDSGETELYEHVSLPGPPGAWLPAPMPTASQKEQQCVWFSVKPIPFRSMPFLQGIFWPGVTQRTVKIISTHWAQPSTLYTTFHFRANPSDQSKAL